MQMINILKIQLFLLFGLRNLFQVLICVLRKKGKNEFINPKLATKTIYKKPTGNPQAGMNIFYIHIIH